MPTDSELLRLEAETLWTLDARGRLVLEWREGSHPAPCLVIARATDGQFGMIGAVVPGNVAQELTKRLDCQAANDDPTHTSHAITSCLALLAESLGPVECRSGPSYLVADVVHVAPTISVCTSAAGLPAEVASPPGWTDAEWLALMAGRMGPWAAALAQDRVISLCHSSRLTEAAAEAGVWTDPEFRGQGHAASVTAAWASLFAGGGRTLFYSTTDENTSSKAVAARLRLRQIGRMWQFAPTGSHLSA